MHEKQSIIEGGCACSNVRYQLTSPPMFVHCCHCHWCQRETGAAFAVNALIESERLQLIQGTTITVKTPSESGSGQTIVRCPHCMVAVWSHYSAAGESVSFVRVGTLDDPNRHPPDIHIYVASKQDWVVLPNDVPATPRYYQRSTYWPSESLERYQTVTGLLRYTFASAYSLQLDAWR